MTEARLRAVLAEPRLARLMALLNADGQEARVVGGAARNALLGLPIEDVDIATTARPEVVTARARAAGFRPAPTGFDHGTVTVVIDRKAFEVTTLRHDVETDGRHARVVFGRDFDADARRRDFTINAFSLSADGVLHDPLGARDDLVARRVRFIGDAGARIAEDYLRILRFFRFHALYGRGPLDAAGLAAAIAGRAGLARVSGERARTELFKLLAAPDPVPVVTAMTDGGLFLTLLGAVVSPPRLERLLAEPADVGEMAPRDSATPRSDSATPHSDSVARRLDGAAGRLDSVARLGALAVRVVEDVDALRGRLKLSNVETRRLRSAAQFLETWHGAPCAPHGARLAELALRHGAATIGEALRLAALDAPAQAGYAAARAALAHYGDLKPPVSGDDFKKRGLTEGKAIGVALKTLQAAWIRADFPRDPAVVARLIDEAAHAALAHAAQAQDAQAQDAHAQDAPSRKGPPHDALPHGSDAPQPPSPTR